MQMIVWWRSRASSHCCRGLPEAPAGRAALPPRHERAALDDDVQCVAERALPVDVLTAVEAALDHVVHERLE